MTESNLFSSAVNCPAHIKVNDVDYSVKPDDTLEARETGVQLASECLLESKGPSNRWIVNLVS